MLDLRVRWRVSTDEVVDLLSRCDEWCWKGWYYEWILCMESCIDCTRMGRRNLGEMDERVK